MSDPSSKTSDLRPAIVAEIMKLVQPARIKLDPRPSIAELEKLRNDENADLRVEPNGDVTIRDLKPRTVHDVANAVMGIVDPAIARRERIMEAMMADLEQTDHVCDETWAEAREIVLKYRERTNAGS